MSFFQINIMYFKRTLQQHYVLGVRFYIPMEYENKTEAFGKKSRKFRPTEMAGTEFGICRTI